MSDWKPGSLLEAGTEVCERRGPMVKLHVVPVRNSPVKPAAAWKVSCCVAGFPPTSTPPTNLLGEAAVGPSLQLALALKIVSNVPQAAPKSWIEALASRRAPAIWRLLAIA